MKTYKITTRKIERNEIQEFVEWFASTIVYESGLMSTPMDMGYSAGDMAELIELRFRYLRFDAVTIWFRDEDDALACKLFWG